MLNMGDLTPAGDFPDSCRSIGTRGGKMAAVRTEGDGRRTGGLCEPRDLLPGGPLPNANETFPSASGQERAAGTEVRALEIKLTLKPRDFAARAGGASVQPRPPLRNLRPRLP